METRSITVTSTGCHDCPIANDNEGFILCVLTGCLVEDEIAKKTFESNCPMVANKDGA